VSGLCFVFGVNIRVDSVVVVVRVCVCRVSGCWYEAAVGAWCSLLVIVVVWAVGVNSYLQGVVCACASVRAA